MKPSIPAFLGSMILGAVLAAPFPAFTQTANVISANPKRLAVPDRTPLRRIDPSLRKAVGPVDVVVQLSEAPLALANGENARRVGGLLSRGQQVAHSQRIRQKQDDVLGKVLALGGKEIARVRIAYNAAIVRIDASKLESIAGLPGVAGIHRVVDYKINLDDTVPYVGAEAARQAGLDGRGVTVAVLDSGIDYTHRNLGGPGTAAAYAAAYGNGPGDPRHKTRDGLFPTKKVIGGYDFVGETWDGDEVTVLDPDPDPIDRDGHGTHVADIIAGRSKDGKHVGIAPGASLIAYKVCSAISTSCNGAAILQAIDRALDPDDDGCMDDAVDVINLSLGAPYGQREDSSSAAAANAARAGVVVVAAAGNSGDKPYVLGSPSSAPEVISVAQTHVPTSALIPLVVLPPSPIAGTYNNTANVEWAPVTEEDSAEGDVVYLGRACTVTEAIPLPENPAGKIALIDRGTCNISEKVRAASDAGALGVLIGLVAAGDAVSFSNGGECPLVPDGTCKPTIVIQLAAANAIKANLAAGVRVSISRDNGLPLVSSIVSTSARGPSYDFNQIKPDIGAPGAMMSAEVGTGTGETAFGGTSGATPVVSGAAALLLQAYPHRSPAEIKSLLMNTAYTDIFTNPITLPDVLAPITRIGAGEVRVDAALASTTAAWETQRRSGSLSFGYVNASSPLILKRTVRVQNYSRFARRYSVSNEFRYANDAANGAVQVLLPSNVFVPGRGSQTFDVLLKIDPAKLPVWTLNGGFDGGTGSLLQSVEYDGYIHLKDSQDEIHLPWHVLPHKSAEVRALTRQVTLIGDQVGSFNLRNQSAALGGGIEVFSLTGQSPRIPRRKLPDDGDDRAVIDLDAVGVRLVNDPFDGLVLQFGVSTFGRRAHPLYPALFRVTIDTDRNGRPDFALETLELGGPDTTGQAVVAFFDLRSEETQDVGIPLYYLDADLNSSYAILSVPLEFLEIDENAKFSFDVEAYDNYFEGVITDAVRRMVYTAGVPKFATNAPAGAVLPPRQTASVLVDDIPGGEKASPSQSGFLLLYRDASVEAETISVSVKPKKHVKPKHHADPKKHVKHKRKKKK